jgi:hypothetical protein
MCSLASRQPGTGLGGLQMDRDLKEYPQAVDVIISAPPCSNAAMHLTTRLPLFLQAFLVATHHSTAIQRTQVSAERVVERWHPVAPQHSTAQHRTAQRTQVSAERVVERWHPVAQQVVVVFKCLEDERESRILLALHLLPIRLRAGTAGAPLSLLK